MSTDGGDQKTAGESLAEAEVEASLEDVVEDADTADVKHRPSSSGASQPAGEDELQDEQHAETAAELDTEAQEETSAEDLHAGEAEEELDKITMSAPALYVIASIVSTLETKILA